MKTENGKIIEATRRELCNIWITDDWEDFVSFPDFLRYMERTGVKITEEGPMDERERMIKLIQDAVGERQQYWCPRYWAVLIAEKLMQNGVGFNGISIDVLDLSVRAYNSLKRAGINTIEELREWDEARLLSVRNAGKTIVAEVMEKLAEWEKRRAEDDAEKRYPMPQTLPAEDCYLPWHVQALQGLGSCPQEKT